MGQVILVTGASSGIGRACAARLARTGHRVYGASRNPAPDSFLTIRADVTDDASVSAALAQVLELEKGIDAVVLSAGFSMLGAVEDTAAADARDIFETNYWGVVRVVSAVLPLMRRRGGGHIVVISSVAGRVGVPFRAYYSSTKFALEGFCEALSLEVACHNIAVSLVAPGHVPTRLGANRRKATASADYADAFDRCVMAVEQQDVVGTDVSEVAELVASIIDDPAPKLRYTVGSFTERASIFLRNLLPDRVFHRILMRHYRPR